MCACVVASDAMASDSSDESNSSEISKEHKATRISNSDVLKFQAEFAKERQRSKHKHQGDYNTFVVPEILCQCQQRCTERVTPALIQKICMYFFGMKGNKERQKSYLASLILAKEKQIDVNAMKGKRVRKMSYRYFVPLLTDKDLKDQSQENTVLEIADLKNKTKKIPGKSKPIPIFEDRNWDHVEVCLKAFTTVHIISEKKVIVTRSVCQLKSTIRCSKPFQKDSLHGLQTTPQDKSSLNGTIRMDVTDTADIPGTSDVSAATAAWLMQSSKKNAPFPVNPKTFLPEGLIIPDSMICLPIFSDTEYIPSDPDRDVDIVDNFFFNQLWKPEYISESSLNRKNKSSF